MKALFAIASRLITCGSRRRVEWNGWKGHLPSGCIFAANHPTSLDPLYVLDVLGYPTLLVTEFALQLPVVGFVLRQIPTIAVPINDGDNRRRYAYSAALNALLSGHNLLIAPEGKMSPESGGKAKTGAVRLALQANVPIVPVGIHHAGTVYTFRLCHNGHIQKVRFMPFGRTTIRLGAPLQYEFSSTAQDGAALLMREIHRLL